MVSHFRVAPYCEDGHLGQLTMEERNAMALDIFDRFLDGPTTSRAAYDMRNTLVEAQTILRGHKDV